MAVEQNSYDLDFRANILTVTKQKREHKFIDVALKKKEKKGKRDLVLRLEPALSSRHSIKVF